MPAQPEKQIERDTAMRMERDAAMVKLSSKMTAQELGRIFNLTSGRVFQILAREMADAAWDWSDRDYVEARWEHAALLRAEGLTLEAIAPRLGVESREQARVLVAKAARRLAWATRRTHFHVTRGDGVPLNDAVARRLAWLYAKAEAMSYLTYRQRKKIERRREAAGDHAVNARNSLR